jgi:HEAT repeat protein
LENILKILECGNNEEKIKLLETLNDTYNPEILEKIILKLSDDDIQVRGEAFSSLVLNKNKISDVLIKNLNSGDKNIRSFSTLVLANRNEVNSIQEIMKLANDEHSIVRSCVIGALEFLKAQEAKEIFLESLLDSNLEVRKSALHAIINLNITISEDRMEKIVKEKDHEMEKMLSKLKK